MSNCDTLRTMSISELEIEMEEIETDYKKKFLSTADYRECRDSVIKVLKEKRQEQNCMEAFKRAMIGI